MAYTRECILGVVRTVRCVAIGVLMLLGLLAGCRTASPSSVAAPTKAGLEHQEASVRPGINDPYEDPDVDTWIGRFESESREIYHHRQRIVDALGIQPGTVIADVGAGTGLFEPLFSKAVGPDGKVLAVDLVPTFLAHIRERARALGLRNVQTVRCDEDGVRLSPDSVDLVFVCDTYHHFEYPQSTLASIRNALRPGGELIVIDFQRVKGESREWIMNHVRAGEGTVRSEICQAGFVLAADQPDDSFLKENYVLRFRKPPSMSGGL